MKPNQNWSDKKPTKPGVYMTRWNNDRPKLVKHEERVTVTRKGRGLSVYCAKYNDRAAMSEIGDDELQWRKIE